MKIKELEQASGIPRASIRFYEKEGLLEPERMENGYREYSDADLEALRKIVLLRTLQVPLKDIRALQLGEDALDRVLERQLTALGAQRSALDKSLRVCRELRDAHVDYRDLPAQKYLDSFDREPRAAVAEADRLPKVQAPVRRFFARELDLLLYNAVWASFLALVCGFGVNCHRRGTFLVLLDIAVPLLMMLLIEPLLLHAWGTTPGKWVLGLGVTAPEGGRLSYMDGLSRTGRVIVRGMGLHLPFVELVRLWKSYRTCDKGEPLSWEEDSLLTLRDERPWRSVAYGFLAAVILALAALGMQFGGMPRHRGELTAAEFSKNFNYLARYYNVDFDAVLTESGGWTTPPDSASTGIISITNGERPPAFFFLEGAAGISEVGFHYECRNMLPSSHQDPMTVASLAFACAQKGFGALSRSRREMLDAIREHPFQSFDYSRNGIRVRCQVEYRGYRLIGNRALFPEDTTDRLYTMDFSICRTE